MRQTAFFAALVAGGVLLLWLSVKLILVLH